MEEFRYIFEGVEEPGKSNATRHDLHEMLMIGLLSTMCGGENSLHWVLDVTMNEDAARNRKENGPDGTTLS
jgi:predicted metal-dependent enzyme (double-stranded beta helix superfamily)